MSTDLLEETQSRVQLARPWQVILFNDEWHPFDQVVLYIQKATGCSEPAAHAITLAAHQTGQSSCYAGPLETCERVAAKLEEIRLRVSIERAP
jgi:ATP-dependent Clp protease adaptor protein ClpS